ncbi:MULTISPECIES: DUF1287 domain-containing protein [unclassified Stenotrophomonas]|uniref:DUF1287 domain-containing protein n=1 Tax=unclassified Stenotrophomonas TaxID=196198 RepID=UPI000D171F88|nr:MULTISPECIES: DUF1287 domain-containing protein [unclassified Stenotrophomonas]PTA73249.1 DUF1287 domain-containing protein [Stenotrophomonas sp. Nf1]PTA83342.1 DUF1287 domain-containing protein [Stenotrophomonas sp. Nf4]
MMRAGRAPGTVLLLTLAIASGCQPAPPPSPGTAQSEDRRPAQQTASSPLVTAARAQIGVTTRYDPAYRVLAYPGGDVPADRGVCTDVVVRALRSQGLDLQARVHEDMRDDFSAYPAIWGLSRPDRNIDHRRVPNLMRWFERQGWQQPITAAAADYAAGDIVAWKLNGNGLLHVGIVSDRRLADGTPLVLHNIARGTREENLLFLHAIIGHYRMPGP